MDCRLIETHYHYHLFDVFADLALAETYATHELYSPYIVIWFQHLFSGNADAAREIYEKYMRKLTTLPSVETIILEAEKSDDHRPVSLLIDLLKTRKIHRQELTELFKCQLGIFSRTHCFDKAADALRDAERYIDMNEIPRELLDNIEKGLNTMNKMLPRKFFRPRRTS